MRRRRERFVRCHGLVGFVACGIAVLCGGLLQGCRRPEFPVYAANYREYAYVTNAGSDTVTVVDVPHVRVDREIAVGPNPSGVAVNPTRNEVYVVNTGRDRADGMATNGSLSVIDAEKNRVVATIPLRRKPYFVDVDAAGKFAYVANSGSNTVSVIDLQLRREAAEIGAGEQPGLARISTDGRSLVVTNRRGNSISVIGIGANPAADKVRSVIEGCPGATDAVILPDSSKAFVACSDGRQVMAIALAEPATAAAPARPDRMEVLLDVGKNPVHLALKPDGGEVFASNFDAGSVSEIATTTDDVGGSFLMGEHPVRGIVSRDNTLLFESNFRSQEITVYSIDDGKRTGVIHVGDSPDAMAFSANGFLLFAVDAGSGDVAVIRAGTQSLFTLLPCGRQPGAIAVKAFRMP